MKIQRRPSPVRSLVATLMGAATLASVAPALADGSSREPALDPATVPQHVLELVNAARARGRDCGLERFGPTQPLRLSAALSSVASGHAADMARNGSLAHTGSDGSNADQRITRAGYAGQASAENVAAGQHNVESVVASWLASPGHCAALMRPHFKEMGVAFALAPEASLSIYWTQVLATPQ
jgi:uncharacterized protein YkwD